MVAQALAAIPSINSEAVQQRLDRVRTYYELLNMPFEASQLTQRLHMYRNFCQVILSLYSYSCCRPYLPSLQNMFTCSPPQSEWMHKSLLFNTLYRIILTIYFHRYANLLNVQVPGREIAPDAHDRVSEILSL